jgi:hypothetical protein
MNSKDHMETTISNIASTLNQFHARLDAMKTGEKIFANKLSEEIATNSSLEQDQVYFMLRMLLKGYPNVKVTRGKHGGIEKL